MKLRLPSEKLIETVRLYGFLCGMGLLLVPLAHAELKVEVTQGIEGRVPIAIAPFRGEPADLERRYHRIISDDLSYSGLFSIVESDFSELARADGDVDYDLWLSHGVEKIVIGELQQSSRVRVELHDSVRRKRIKEFSIVGGATVDSVAHQVSDLIHEELTGFPGIFSTRIVFVAAEHYSWRRHKNTLYISDADGRNARPIYSSSYQIMSPVWSPDRKRIAYVSYEEEHPSIVMQTIATGHRELFDAYTGPAMLPSWSDDGKRLAYVSSAGGNSDIYIIDLESKRVSRITDTPFIDTEPAWAPNGTLIFTSDRSGSPQLYRVDKESTTPRRITFHGLYNSDANVSPQGDQIAFLSQREEGFLIVVKDFTQDDGDEVELVSNPGVEGARFTANGQLLGYITDRNGKSVFGLMTVDGVFGKLIPLPEADVRGAAWSSFTW